jgi:hypothetical protein
MSLMLMKQELASQQSKLLDLTLEIVVFEVEKAQFLNPMISNKMPKEQISSLFP